MAAGKRAELTMEVEQQIRRLLDEDPDMSISALGRELGVHHGTVGRWLRKLDLYRPNPRTAQTAAATATHAERMRAQRREIAAGLLTETERIGRLQSGVVSQLVDRLPDLDDRNLIDLLAKSSTARYGALSRHLELDKRDEGDPKVDAAMSMAHKLIEAFGVHGPDPDADDEDPELVDEHDDGPR